MQDQFSRGRSVVYLARDLLRLHGYHVIRPSGAHTPEDLVAWKPGENILVVQVRRTRAPIGKAFRVARYFHRDLQALREIKQPEYARVQLWLWTDCHGWRFFLVMPGGICEVADYVA